MMRSILTYECSFISFCPFEVETVAHLLQLVVVFALPPFAVSHASHLHLCNGKAFIVMLNSSVIRQKSESQNGCFKKTKQAKFSEKRTFLTP